MSARLGPEWRALVEALRRYHAGVLGPDSRHVVGAANALLAADRDGEAQTAKCADCGLPYGGPGWMDVVLPKDIWTRISPDGEGNGLLCITCMARRCQRQGLTCPVSITSGPFGLWHDAARDRMLAPGNVASPAPADPDRTTTGGPLNTHRPCPRCNGVCKGHNAFDAPAPADDALAAGSQRVADACAALLAGDRPAPEGAEWTWRPCLHRSGRTKESVDRHVRDCQTVLQYAPAVRDAAPVVFVATDEDGSTFLYDAAPIWDGEQWLPRDNGEASYWGQQITPPGTVRRYVDAVLAYERDDGDYEKLRGDRERCRAAVLRLYLAAQPDAAPAPERDAELDPKLEGMLEDFVDAVRRDDPLHPHFDALHQHVAQREQAAAEAAITVLSARYWEEQQDGCDADSAFDVARKEAHASIRAASAPKEAAHAG